MKKALRTDDSCFENLPGYPFQAHYIEVTHPDYDVLRMHYIDEGDKHATPVLLAHGCPAWSYLYRNVIPPLVDAGYRVIAPDHMGSGRSDKLLQRQDYTYQHYVNWFKQLITDLDLYNISLVCQDWGGPISLRCVSEMPERFSALVITNTLLPNCEPAPRGVDNWPGEIIDNWVNYTASAKDIKISDIIQGVTTTDLPAAILAAYDAPFPDERYKQGMLNWPSLIPRTESTAGVEENRRAWQVLENLEIPALTAFSDQDPSTIAWEAVFQSRLKGAQNVSHTTIENAGHMVQEDQGQRLAQVIVDFIA